MTIYRCILASWKLEEDPSLPKVCEGQFTQDELDILNTEGYNIYYLPNYPSEYSENVTVTGKQIDRFDWLFVDMDLKDKIYKSKEEFIKKLQADKLIPSKIIDSGNGIHAYWKVKDLDAMSYLRLSRRLMRHFKTDEAVGQIFQLMRAPFTVNTKYKGEEKLCIEVDVNTIEYTSEAIDKLLPPITFQDEQYCKTHYDKTYGLNQKEENIDSKIPLKFSKLIESNEEVKRIWSGGMDDRSKGDYRLAHIMFANGFNRQEALSVLVNCAKALSRAPIHRISYATNIVDQIWTFELEQDKKSLTLSNSVRELLVKGPDAVKGTRFACHRYIDATQHGFRLGQVIGLIAGSGVGKTAMALNMFDGFVKSNPDYHHFFIPLEQPANEIADRWQAMCGNDTSSLDKVHVISNYSDTGEFRHLSLEEIKTYILKFQTETSNKVGAVVIDHIGALKKKGKAGENQDLMDICHAMKAFAVQTNTMVIMQSQAPREKAGIGDLELNKDAAYGTVYFESYCDYVITMWQPLKRVYDQEGALTVTSFKFCKIRHKKQGLDQIKEDVRYNLLFDPTTERMRELTEQEEKSFDFWNKTATNLRKQDRKTDVLKYSSITWTKDDNGTVQNN